MRGAVAVALSLALAGALAVPIHGQQIMRRPIFPAAASNCAGADTDDCDDFEDTDFDNWSVYGTTAAQVTCTGGDSTGNCMDSATLNGYVIFEVDTGGTGMWACIRLDDQVANHNTARIGVILRHDLGGGDNDCYGVVKRHAGGTDDTFFATSGNCEGANNMNVGITGATSWDREIPDTDWLCGDITSETDQTFTVTAWHFDGSGSSTNPCNIDFADWDDNDEANAELCSGGCSFSGALEATGSHGGWGRFQSEGGGTDARYAGGGPTSGANSDDFCVGSR